MLLNIIIIIVIIAILIIIIIYYTQYITYAHIQSSLVNKLAYLLYIHTWFEFGNLMLLHFLLVLKLQSNGNFNSISTIIPSCSSSEVGTQIHMNLKLPVSIRSVNIRTFYIYTHTHTYTSYICIAKFTI